MQPSVRLRRTALALLITAPALLPTTPTATADDVKITIQTTPDSTTNPPQTDALPTDAPAIDVAIDVAILLDTSNSMDGLINQARTQLWKIVRELADTEKDGQTPSLRVAVLEYGNTDLPATEDYIRTVVPLTDDLDRISQGLFGLDTDGGDEYCGAVIDAAIKRLNWSDQAGAFKVIFIAGNEPFDQGTTPYQSACATAAARGILVNTLHCGPQPAGVSGHWSDAAKIAGGKFMNIDQDRRIVRITAPQDKLILELNTRLNKTYLWYGQREQREALETNQIAQDANADRFGSATQRALTKSTAAYSNVGRDLIDTYAKDPEILDKLDDTQLPQPLQNLPPQQRVEKLNEITAQRKSIQTQLADLAKARQAYIETQTTPGKDENTLGSAITTAIQSQLRTAGFQTK